MALCSFCEEDVQAGVRRGENVFCSPECADSFFLTAASRTGAAEDTATDELDLDDYEQAQSAFEGQRAQLTGELDDEENRFFD